MEIGSRQRGMAILAAVQDVNQGGIVRIRSEGSQGCEQMQDVVADAPPCIVGNTGVNTNPHIYLRSHYSAPRQAVNHLGAHLPES